MRLGPLMTSAKGACGQTLSRPATRGKPSGLRQEPLKPEKVTARTAWDRYQACVGYY